MRGFHVSPLVVFVVALGWVQSVANAQVTVNVTNTSLVIKTHNGSYQVYPPGDVQPTDYCPDASWKHWKLHSTPPNYDPIHWTNSQWREYIMNYPLRSAGLSIAFLLIGVGALLVAITWRLVQWCVSCGHCQRSCAVGTQDTAFLTDTKHGYLKAWTYLLIVAALAMVVWGMLALDRGLLASFWAAFVAIMDYGRSISDSLVQLKSNITEGVPAKLEATSQAVNGTIMKDRLGYLVQVSLQFNNDTKTASNSLLSDTRALESGLTAGVMSGMVSLATQFGKPIPGATPTNGSGAHRRRLAQSSSSSSAASSYDKLYGLLPALSTSLPVVSRADDTRGAIRDQLQALQAALSRFQAAAAPSPSSPEVVALSGALDQTRLATWDMQLASVGSGLQAYNASRSGPALTSAADTAEAILEGSGSLSSSAVAALQRRVNDLTRQLATSSAYPGLKALRVHLLNVSNQVASVSHWNIRLANGTKMGILDMATYLLGAMSQYVTADESTGLGATSAAAAANGTGAVSVATFMSAARNASAVVAGLNTSVTSLAAAAADARGIATDGPDAAAAAAQIATSLRPALTDLSGPIGAVGAALAAYDKDPSAANLAALRAAAGAAAGPVGSAAAAFTAPLADAAALESTCQALLPVVARLQVLGSSFVGTASYDYTYDTLEVLGVEVQSYEAGVGQLVGLMRQLPVSTDARDAVIRLADDIQDMVAEVVGDVRDRVREAAVGLSKALDGLNGKLLTPASDFINKYKSSTDAANRIAYPVSMAAWGLGALLLLGLALSVLRNWPAGLLLFGLALLTYITLSQAVTSALSFALAVVDDGCSEVEEVLLRQLVEHSNNPEISVALSYYMYKVPPTPDIMLQAAFNLNVTDVRLRLASINETLSDRMDSVFELRGRTAFLVSALRSLGAATRSLFDDVIRLLRYDTVHLLYISTKSAVCCDAGTFAYHQWCAITAMAALSFGALIPAAYLLCRMDMVQQRRRGCCSCATCACYRPHASGAYRAGGDPEAQEDKFAKEAKKQHEEEGHHHGRPSHPPGYPTKPMMMGGGSGNGEFYGVAGGCSELGAAAGGRPVASGGGLPGSDLRAGQQQQQLPGGFFSAAGGAAAAAALQGSPPPPPPDPCYSAPSAPAMTADKL